MNETDSKIFIEAVKYYMNKQAQFFGDSLEKQKNEVNRDIFENKKRLNR